MSQMRPHMAFLKKHYSAGTFVVSGRKIPRDGGVIIAAGKTRAEIEAIVQDDPFVKRGLAEFRIISFARVSARTTSAPGSTRRSSC